MGQYYTAVLSAKNNRFLCAHPHTFGGNGAKLTEHSWIGNYFVSGVLRKLTGNPRRVWWLGDYATQENYKSSYSLSDSQKEQAEDTYSHCSGKTVGAFTSIMPGQIPGWNSWTFDNYYLINWDKKSYVRLKPADPDRWELCPLPLLTAVGNGKGGGDYFGVNAEYVGIWAGDRISVKPALPVGCERFSDETQKYFFEEE